MTVKVTDMRACCVRRLKAMCAHALPAALFVIVGMVVIMQMAMIVMVMVVFVVVAVRVSMLVRVVAVGVMVAVLVLVGVGMGMVVGMVVLALEFVVAGLFLGTAIAIIAHVGSSLSGDGAFECSYASRGRL